MAKVVLDVDIDAVTKKACPKFEGTLQLPGRQPELVTIEKLPPLPPGIFASLNQTPIASGEIRDRNQQQQQPQTSQQTTDKINLDKTPEPPTSATLEAIYSQDDDLPASVFSAAEWELLSLAGEAGSLTVRDAQNSNLARREGWDSGKIKAFFARFSELGLGSIHHGARGSVEFRVNEK